MEKEKANTVWLLFGNGLDSRTAFCPGVSNHPDAQYDCSPLYVKVFREAGFHVDFTNDAYGLQDVAAVISLDTSPRILENLKRYDRKKCFLLQFEPPVVSPNYYVPEMKNYFGKIFTMMDDLADGENYYKFCMPLHNDRLKKTSFIPNFENKKLCSLFNSNKFFYGTNELYTERQRAIQYLTQTGEFDLYGPGWAGIPSWQGKTPTSFTFKVNNIKNYKFIICYENMGNQRGYVSEKLLDAFVGGCVPIYLGADNVTDYVPGNTFIDKKKFGSYEELYSFMKKMPKEEYLGYLQAADDFLASSESRRFSFDTFTNDIVKEIKKSNP